ncbi:Protein SMG8, partial [Cucurbita argyrosperma subsp. argyrosperma]
MREVEPLEQFPVASEAQFFSHSWTYLIHPLTKKFSGRHRYQHPLPLQPRIRRSFLILPHRIPLLPFLLHRRRRRRNPFLAFPTTSSSSVSLGGDLIIRFNSSIGLSITMFLDPVNWMRKRKLNNSSSGDELVTITRRKEAFCFCSLLPTEAPCSRRKPIMIRRFKNMSLAIFRESFLCSLTLQSAKYALVKSRPKPPLPSRLRSSSASYSSLFPGRCTPVILFIFIDDFSDGLITNFSKKLQSSLEAQIRFLIKNFWRLNGSRGGSASRTASLFPLDALKAVVLVDRSANRTAESLEFAISLMEDVSDSLLLESHGESASQEDLVSLKEFISRRADFLRGGAFTTHELPSMQIWLSSSKRIIQEILSAKCGCIDKLETRKRKPRPWYVPSVSIERNALGIAVSSFSTSWCERVLPGAKEVYLRDLPACYFKSQHEAHMEKAVLALHSMVKGPAVQHFAERLKEECKSIWMSGRQLCDAVSLTGKPCLHQRHSSEDHSSGYVFRHACGCGRSLRLRTDPFDFESANVTFNRFAGCDNFLAVVQLPGVSITGHIQLSSWTLIRVGAAKYYEASKGLLQSGFYPTQSMNALMGTVSIGFEHECPHGHRFLLNPDHLKELGSSYAACNVADPLKYGKRGRHGKARDSVNAANATIPSKSNCIRRMIANGIEDNGCGLFMLNRDLPIFMNCPHCKLSKNGKDPPNVKICGTISQLQRIFMELGLPPAVPERQQKL